ncbi:MAG: D-amino acid dehydrogenase [Betaproteobacteria bacterium]|nr:D-amino acid dehydrogenase [Betaproteobacteria bacterium]
MKVAVLGAGVIGVASAWYLGRAGHEVTVVDRQPEPALETSYANGGQISVSHAVPWANPAAPLQILRWLGRADAPLKFRPRADLHQWLWGMRFLLECLPARTRDNTRRILALARASIAALQALRVELGVAYHQQARGILSVYTERRALDDALSHLDLLRAGNIRCEPRTAEECVAIEPALQGARVRLAGGIYAPDDESGDAHVFTRALAAENARRGVRFLFGHTVERLLVEGGRVAGAQLAAPERGARRLTADAYVVALGSWSPLLTRPAGIDLPVYPVKGYSVTLPVRVEDEAPHVSLTDEAHKIVFSRLGDCLRVAGTAELAGYDARVDGVRCAAILERVFALFPRAGDRAQASQWAGLRPATPGNVPLIGATRYPNLFLNTGHGTLGWTLACGSGLALAEIVSGRSPDVDFVFGRTA